MTISFVRDAVNKLAQSVDQFFQGESGGACARREFPSHLAELTFALDRFLFRLSYR